jgi:SM-20-related protein
MRSTLPFARAEGLDTLLECGWVRGDAFADPGLCLAARDALEALRASGALRPARVGRDERVRLDAGVRGDWLVWLDPGRTLPAPLETLAAEVEMFRKHFCEATRSSVMRNFELQAGWYPGQGEVFARHLDEAPSRTRGPHTGGRWYTAIVYLNPDWTPDHGGCLHLWDDAGTRHTVEPRLGAWVCFESQRIAHEVAACHAPRWAVTAWLRQDEPLDPATRWPRTTNLP